MELHRKGVRGEEQSRIVGRKERCFAVRFWTARAHIRMLASNAWQDCASHAAFVFNHNEGRCLDRAHQCKLAKQLGHSTLSMRPVATRLRESRWLLTWLPPCCGNDHDRGVCGAGFVGDNTSRTDSRGCMGNQRTLRLPCPLPQEPLLAQRGDDAEQR
jgi:hypothetical protein